MEYLLTVIFVLLALAQLIWLFLQQFYFPKAKKGSLEEFPSISVIIAARNEEENLKKLVPELIKQVYKGQWELIVVLDRCTDASKIYLDEQQKHFDKLHILNQSESDIPKGQSPKKTAILKAIEKANYNLILQTDADCYPSTDLWIEEMLKARDSDSLFVIGISPYENRKGWLNQIIQFDTAITALSMCFFAENLEPYMSLGRNQMFDKTHFLKKGAYGNHISIAFGDDDLLLQHLAPGKKCNTCVTKSSFMVSIPKTNLRDWLNQKLRHMMAGKYYKIRFRSLLVLNYLTIPFYVFFVLSIMFSSSFWPLLIGIFLIRSLLFSIILYRISGLTGSGLKLALIPFSDLIHSLLIFYTGIKAQRTKIIEWQ